MKIQGNFHNIALAFAHSCIGDGTTMCDFKDIVYLVSTLPSPMKLSVPRHDAEYNHQPHLGEPTLGTPIEFVADVHNPEDVLRLVVLLNNMLLDTIHLLYLVELAVSNRQGDEKILEICKSRNAYHIN